MSTVFKYPIYILQRIDRMFALELVSQAKWIKRTSKPIRRGKPEIRHRQNQRICVYLYVETPPLYWMFVGRIRIYIFTINIFIQVLFLIQKYFKFVSNTFLPINHKWMKEICFEIDSKQRKRRVKAHSLPKYNQIAPCLVSPICIFMNIIPLQSRIEEIKKKKRTITTKVISVEFGRY